MKKILLRTVDVISDAIVIFCSFVLSVIIRYKVMDVEPGINALSAPYLLVAVLYSFMVAASLLVVHASEKYLYRAYQGDILKDFYFNTISCLLLLCFFYIAGIGYFSRLAMIMFWVISTIAIYVKKMILRRVLYYIRSKGKNRIHVLIIGEGDIANRYIQSVDIMPELGINIIGYLGGSARKAEGYKVLHEKQQTNKPNWIGFYTDYKQIIDKNYVNEVIIATEDFTDLNLREILEFAKIRDIRVSIIPSFSSLLTNKVIIKEIGEIKLICLNSETKPKTIFVFGLFICAVLLFLILVLGAFPLVDNTLSKVKDYESYKCVIFGFSCLLLNFTLYPNVNNNVLNSVLISLGVSFGTVICYNSFFFLISRRWLGMGEDIMAVIVVSVVCFIMKTLFELIKRNDGALIL